MVIKNRSITVSMPDDSVGVLSGVSSGIAPMTYNNNLCQEILLGPAQRCSLPYNEPHNENPECIYSYSVAFMGYIRRTECITWAMETFGAANMDVMRPGNDIYFKYEADRTMFILKFG